MRPSRACRVSAWKAWVSRLHGLDLPQRNGRLGGQAEGVSVEIGVKGHVEEGRDGFEVGSQELSIANLTKSPLGLTYQSKLGMLPDPPDSPCNNFDISPFPPHPPNSTFLTLDLHPFPPTSTALTR
ncbi:hypothetical protein PtB15_1B782 [Puccinia triticina]|nr:hypothetical protein PtB15_1B782 [Puccinia triticina]